MTANNVYPLRPNMPAFAINDEKPRERAVLHAAGDILAREMAAQILAGDMTREEAAVGAHFLERMLKRAKGERT